MIVTTIAHFNPDADIKAYPKVNVSDVIEGNLIYTIEIDDKIIDVKI